MVWNRVIVVYLRKVERFKGIPIEKELTKSISWEQIFVDFKVSLGSDQQYFEINIQLINNAITAEEIVSKVYFFTAA